jgi:hypothetical protein
MTPGKIEASSGHGRNFSGTSSGFASAGAASVGGATIFVALGAARSAWGSAQVARAAMQTKRSHMNIRVIYQMP